MGENYHHGDLRAALVEAALEGLQRDGAVPSWRALARACNVSQTAPYRHFESFEALQAAVAAEGFRRLSQQIKTAAAGISDPLERLAAGIRAYIAFGRAHGSWYALMFSGIADRSHFPEAGEAGGNAFGLLVGVVAEAGADNPPAVAYTIWAAHHGLTDLFRGRLKPPDFEHTADALVERNIAMAQAYLRTVVEGDRARTAP